MIQLLVTLPSRGGSGAASWAGSAAFGGVLAWVGWSGAETGWLGAGAHGVVAGGACGGDGRDGGAKEEGGDAP